MKAILKNKKKVTSITFGIVALSLIGGVVFCQGKYNNAIIYASELNATATVNKYQDQGLLIKPDTINKIISEADNEVLALEEQAILIAEKEATLNNALATSKDFNASEKETLEKIKVDYESNKTTYNEDISLSTGETYLDALTNLQVQYDQLVNENQARLDQEAKSSGGEVVYDEADGTYEVNYENDDTSSSNDGNSSGSSSSSDSSGGESNLGSGGSSNSGSDLESSSGGGSATPPPSNGGSTCDAIDWGYNNGEECITEDPYSGSITVNSSNDICTWIHGMRSYMGASPVGCSVKAGTKGSAYWVGMEYLPSYEYVSKNTNLFPAMLAEPEEGYQKCYYVEFRDGQVFVDGYQQEK